MENRVNSKNAQMTNGYQMVRKLIEGFGLPFERINKSFERFGLPSAIDKPFKRLV